MSDLLDLFDSAPAPAAAMPRETPAPRIPAGATLAEDCPAVRDFLTLANPLAVQAKLFGGGTGIEANIYGYRAAWPGRVFVPIGVASLTGSPARHIETPATSGVSVGLPEGMWLSVDLRSYQEEAVAAAARENMGILVAPPGAGKTVCGLALAYRLGKRPLILVHTKDLMVQWLRSAEKVLGCTLETVGGDLPKSEMRPDLRVAGTVAMMQTLAGWAHIELRQLGEKHGMLLSDEAHHCPCQSLYTILWHVGIVRRYGLTATPKRGDGLTPMLHWCFGPIVARVRNDDLVEAGVSVIPQVRQVQTAFDYPLLRRVEIGHGWGASFRPEVRPAEVEAAMARRRGAKIHGLDDEQVDLWREWAERRGYEVKAMVDPSSLQGMYRTLCTDEDRLRIVAGKTAELVRTGRVTLVLGGRIEHCGSISAGLAEWHGIEAPVLTSRLSAKKRGVVLDAMRAGTVRCAVATSLADEGLDVPGLKGLVLAFPGRSDALTIQRIGRTMRASGGDQRPMVVDIVDGQVGLLANQASARRRACKREGYEMVTGQDRDVFR